MTTVKVWNGSGWVSKPVKFGAPNWRTTTPPAAANPPSVVSYSTAGAFDGNALTVPAPSGSGGLLIAYASAYNPYNGSTPAGWTLIRNTNLSNETSALIYRKTSTGSDDLVLSGFSLSNDPRAGCMVRISGASLSATTPEAAAYTTDAAYKTSPLTPTVDTTVDKCLVLRFTTAQYGGATATHAWPAGQTELIDYAYNKSGTNYWQTIGVAWAVKTPSGATGDVRPTVTTSATAFYGFVGHTIALPPA